MAYDPEIIKIRRIQNLQSTLDQKASLNGDSSENFDTKYLTAQSGQVYNNLTSENFDTKYLTAQSGQVYNNLIVDGEITKSGIPVSVDGHSHDFIALSGAPDSLVGQSGELLVVGDDEDELVFLSRDETHKVRINQSDPTEGFLADKNDETVKINIDNTFGVSGELYVPRDVATGSGHVEQALYVLVSGQYEGVYHPGNTDFVSRSGDFFEPGRINFEIERTYFLDNPTLDLNTSNMFYFDIGSDTTVTITTENGGNGTYIIRAQNSTGSDVTVTFSRTTGTIKYQGGASNFTLSAGNTGLFTIYQVGNDQWITMTEFSN